MVPVDEALFRHLQTLSRLSLPPEEAQAMRPQMERIVEFVRQIEALEAGAEPRPESGGDPPLPPLRDDLTVAGLEGEEALANAPATSGVLFRVPPVFGPESR